MKYKLDLTNIENHKKSIPIDNMLIWAIELKCFNSAKKILNEYPRCKIDNIDFSFLISYFTKSKGIKRIFELLKPLIDFDKIDIETALSGIYFCSDRKRYNRGVLSFIFDNIKDNKSFQGTGTYIELKHYLNA